MWCVHCREDVPGVAKIDSRAYSCPRCGQRLRRPNEAPDEPVAVDAADDAAAARDDGMPLFDSWELDERLRHIQRIVRLESTAGQSTPAAAGPKTVRIDAAHAGPPAGHRPKSRGAGRRHRRSAASSFSLLATVAWTIILLATTAIVCGGILMGWSLLAGRPELWSIGLPVAIGGQVALLVGLVLQMDRLRDEGRTTAEKIESVDEALHELKSKAAVSDPPAGPFHAHATGTAGPQALLSDLKGQLDLLAWKMNEGAG